MKVNASSLVREVKADKKTLMDTAKKTTKALEIAMVAYEDVPEQTAEPLGEGSS